MTLSAQQALRGATSSLQDAQSESPALDARLLLEHVLGMSREALMMADDLALTQAQEAQYRTLIEKRAQRQPVSQLIEKREFWGMDFIVTPDVLDPRPDSETVVEMLLSHIKSRDAALKLLDLGTGTGCLLLALMKELPNATGLGVDKSEKALAVAGRNAERLGFDRRVQFRESSWADNVTGRFDVIVANPPYIPTQVIGTLHPEVCEFEPHIALDGGNDGLDAYRIIMAQLPRLLAPGAVAAFEHGEGQHETLANIAAQHGLAVTEMKKDLAGIVRCILIQQQG